jgi:hypothetical protein
MVQMVTVPRTLGKKTEEKEKEGHGGDSCALTHPDWHR